LITGSIVVAESPSQLLHTFDLEDFLGEAFNADLVFARVAVAAAPAEP
jgi:hypothetical protein